MAGITKKISGFFKKKSNNKIKEEIVQEAVQNISKTVKKTTEPDIQVMMLGARRVGKTSVLASMINQFNNVTDGTNLILTKENSARAIDDALDSMKSHFLNNPSDYDEVRMDTLQTPGFEYFDLRLSIARSVSKSHEDTKKGMSRIIRFKDCAGEWISNYTNEKEISMEIEKSDVIIIAIDSVLLMEKKRKYNKQNAVENVTNFIKENLRPQEGANNHKMVLFVPLKCEKYYWQDKNKESIYYGRRMNELNQAVKEEYHELFSFFQKPNYKQYFDVAILPILTIGGIEFFEFTVDKEAKEVGSENIIYHYTKKPAFNPKYCEQPLIYTLLFEYKKIRNEYENKAYNKNTNKRKITATIWEWIQDKCEWVKDYDYISEMKKLEDCIKENVDGIEIVQGSSIR